MADKASWPDTFLPPDCRSSLIQERFDLLGDASILSRIRDNAPTLALISSIKAPASIILAVHDLAKHWRQHGPIIISGFHSPAENEALWVLSRGEWPFVLVLARSMYQRPPAYLQRPLDNGLVLILSPFKPSVRRVNQVTATIRNRLVAALADEVLIAHAGPGSKTEALAKEISSSGKPVYALDHWANEHLYHFRIKRFSIESSKL